MLFCDEVTTGLDSTSALQVVQTLKGFAQSGRTVVMTIHQPCSEIWELFDRVVLLSRGSCVYEGGTKDCLTYFETLGYTPRPFMNPAEWLIELAAIDNRTLEKEKAGMERFYRLKSSWAKHQAERPPLEPYVVSKTNFPSTGRTPKVSTWKQISVMTRRSMLVSFKDPKGLVGTIAEAIIVGIILGWAFYKLDDSPEGLRSRQGAFYTAAAVQGYLMLVYEVNRCCEEVPIFDREHCEGIVDVIPFLISRRVAKAPEDLLVSLRPSLLE